MVCLVDCCVPSVSGQGQHVAGVGSKEGKRKKGPAHEGLWDTAYTLVSLTSFMLGNDF